MSVWLSGIFVYPLKSARGIPLNEAQLSARGLLHDRRFMLVDGDGLFLTQRQLPAMARLVPALDGERLRLSFEQLAPLEVPLAPRQGEPCEVRVFQNRMAAIDLGAAPAAFFERALGRPARLVYMPDETRRPMLDDPAEPDDLVSFADRAPFTLVGESSLEALNGRLTEPVPMDRFRPNLVVRGSAPFVEDQWSRLQIGAALLQVREPRTRCAIITIDQQRGERASKEPLTALAGFHAWQGKAAFAQSLVCRGTGTLRLGDNVVVLT